MLQSGIYICNCILHLEGLPEEKEEDDEGHHDVEEEVDLDGFHIRSGRQRSCHPSVQCVGHYNIAPSHHVLFIC